MTFSPISFRSRAFRSRAALALLSAALLGCSDAGLYAINGRGAGGPDKADFSGRACVPLAAGDAFPVRVIYAVQVGGQGLVTQDVVDSLQSIVTRFSLPYIKFGLATFHAVATGYPVGPNGSPGSFGAATDFGNAVTRYSQSTLGTGPTSMRNALQLAKALLDGDMLTGCRGTVARTRYIVVLMVSSADTSCVQTTFNAGLNPTCQALLSTTTPPLIPAQECAKCELDFRTREVKALVEERSAGEVTVVPVYVPPDPVNPDPDVMGDIGAIARAGGTQPVTVRPGPSETPGQALTRALNQINYSSLQQSMVLKHLIGFNRNALSLGGEVLVDSDGDGLSDDYETLIGTEPITLDTDGDGIMDGIEVRMGMSPMVPNTITGCSYVLDDDLDRLNNCEERVLGTDSCVADTDGDSIPDLVEVLSRTNPLDPEDLKDSDADGSSNVDELLAHTDALSDDNDFRSARAYGYTITDGPVTDDGRPCYDFSVDNISLVNTLEKPNPPFPTTPAGTNDLYLYFQVGRQNQVHGAGIGSLDIVQVRFLPPATRSPSGTIRLGPDDFITGN
ncbi:MAG TPA: calcium-binding protein [Myxococcaceae bacterium]|jgi:hypothetical protein